MDPPDTSDSVPFKPVTVLFTEMSEVAFNFSDLLLFQVKAELTVMLPAPPPELVVLTSTLLETSAVSKVDVNNRESVGVPPV